MLLLSKQNCSAFNHNTHTSYILSQAPTAMLIYSRIKLTESGGWEEENGMKKARENLHSWTSLQQASSCSIDAYKSITKHEGNNNEVKKQ